jgi:hypothetical protein
VKRAPLVVACAAVALVLASPALSRSSAVPTKLVGTWVAKNGNRLTISRPGKAVVVLPGYERQTITVAVTGASMRFGRTTLCVRSGRYSWTLAGRLLTLRPVADTCSLRRSFFTGVWKRR